MPRYRRISNPIVSISRRSAALICAGLALMALIIIMTLALSHRGPAARIAFDDASDTLIVNNLRAVRLPARVLDAKGRVVAKQTLHYERMSGDAIPVSANGVITCAQRGDVAVRASLGAIATGIVVRCRPVRAIESSSWINLIVGDSATELPFTAIGVDGRPVMQVRGAVKVLDSTVATLEKLNIRPRARGETVAAVRIGDQETRIRVLVHEQVNAFTGLRPDQRVVAVPVRLARGDTVRLSLPAGALWIKYLPRRVGEPPPSIDLGIIGACSAGGDGLHQYRLPPNEYGTSYCLVDRGPSIVVVAHGQSGLPVVDGWLALDRAELR
jgi:hypothetical protein